MIHIFTNEYKLKMSSNCHQYKIMENGVKLNYEDITEGNYILINNFYKRDIGSLDYFIWKNLKERKYNLSSEISAFFYKRNDICLSILITRKCAFTLKHRRVSINMLSDFGTDESVKSRTLIIESAKQTHSNDVRIMIVDFWWPDVFLIINIMPLMI